MKSLVIVVVAVLACAPVFAESTVLVGGEDVSADYEHFVMKNYGFEYSELSVARVTVSGDFFGGNVHLGEGQYEYLRGGIMVAIYPQGTSFSDGVYDIRDLDVDGAVSYSAPLKTFGGEEHYGGLLEGWMAIMVFFWNEHHGGAIEVNASITGLSVELVVEGALPEERTTISDMKRLYR